jgi:hypothetical protein
MAGAMFTLDWPHGRPTLAEAAHVLKVQPSDLDKDFGVVLIDPVRNAYTVLCRTDACDAAKPSGEGVKGPFSNPGIGAYGPPQPR